MKLSLELKDLGFSDIALQSLSLPHMCTQKKSQWALMSGCQGHGFCLLDLIVEVGCAQKTYRVHCSSLCFLIFNLGQSD